MNRLFKKTLSLMLVIVMTVSLGVSAAAADQTGAAQAEGPLGIVSAMSVELNALVEATKISKTEEIAGNTFYEGVLNGVDVVLVKAGIGKVLAASCAETLIDTYHVGGIVFTGIAGGVGDDVNVMDMVIATELVQHDYGTETNSGFEWNGKAGSNQETGMIPVDESLSKIAYDSACTVLGAEKVHQGVIATGDQFISSESYVKELQTKFNALACEMEGASVARVADEFHVPCAILRCMSDKADGIAHDTYAFNYTEASNTSASVVKEMLNTIAKDRVALPAAKDVAAKDTTPRTAIISAMSVELKALVDAADIQKETVIGSKTYYVGKLNGEDVVLVQAGVGKVLSANYTAALLNFTVKGVVFTGIAGGVGDDVNVMDMVIGTSLVQHDYGTETNNGFVWNGEAGSNQETGMIPVDGTLSKIAYNAACDVLGSAKVHQGVIATGDQFISSESYVKELQTKFDALACEMEGASVARVCDQFGVPCAILRCMSDKADGIAHDTYAFNYTEASNTSASVVQEMMKTLSTTLPFTDVKNTDWCFSEVARVYADGIMGGTSNTTFSPADTLTRGQVVAMLYRMAGSPAVTANTTGFSDVDNGAYYADAVKWASGKEIVGGYADGTFAPNRAITREQLAAILYRYAKANGADISVGEDTNLLSYKDFQSVGQYAVPALQWAVGSGLIGGTTNATLSPKGTATRAQAAVILIRFVGMTAAK